MFVLIFLNILCVYASHWTGPINVEEVWAIQWDAITSEYYLVFITDNDLILSPDNKFYWKFRSTVKLLIKSMQATLLAALVVARPVNIYAFDETDLYIDIPQKLYEWDVVCK